MSTVNGFLKKIASGDTEIIRSLWNTATNPGEKHRRQWRDVWDRLMPQQPLTPQQIALIVQLDSSKAGITGSAAPTEATGEVSTGQQALEPLRAAAEQSVAQLREGAASSVERIGVGGGAAAARALRGKEGPIDKLIAFAKHPTGGVVLVIGGVLALVVITVAIARKR